MGNIQALNRGKKDFPLLMFLELIRNDVCKKSFDSTHKPADFKVNVLRLLDYLDNNVQLEAISLSLALETEIYFMIICMIPSIHLVSPIAMSTTS
jgi:hypothetical protein